MVKIEVGFILFLLGWSCVEIELPSVAGRRESGPQDKGGAGLLAAGDPVVNPKSCGAGQTPIADCPGAAF